MPSEHIPDLLIDHVTALTTQFVLVLGAYNFTIARTFGFPVVALPDCCWHPDYRFFHPFPSARRIELIISRALTQATATTELPLPAELQKAKALSADFQTNMRAVTALAVDRWARPRFKIANGGVLSVAQHKFRANDPFALEEYRKQFSELPRADKEVLDFCKPPDQEFRGPVNAPPRPTLTPFEFDMMSPEEQAARLYASQAWWSERATPSAPPASGFAPVVVQMPAAPDDPNSWKGLPNESERESMRNDDWKKY